MDRIKAKVDVLSEAEIQQIHRAALEVLSTVGCHLPHARVLERLAQAGASVDPAAGCAKLPPELVERALEALTAGRRITPEGKYQRSVLRDGRVGISPGNQAQRRRAGAQGEL